MNSNSQSWVSQPDCLGAEEGAQELSDALMILSPGAGSALGCCICLFKISSSSLVPSGITASSYITWHFSNCFICKFYRQMSLLDVGMKITNLLYERTINHDSGDSLPAQRMENERVSP